MELVLHKQLTKVQTTMTKKRSLYMTNWLWWHLQFWINFILIEESILNLKNNLFYILHGIVSTFTLRLSKSHDNFKDNGSSHRSLILYCPHVHSKELGTLFINNNLAHYQYHMVYSTTYIWNSTPCEDLQREFEKKVNSRNIRVLKSVQLLKISF